jgi:hypothetical protein
MEFARVHAAAAVPQLNGMLQVQHLVKQNVFDGIAGHAWMIKNAADHNGIVGGIVVPEASARMVPAPGKLRAPHEPVKKSAVQVVENFFEMIMMSAGGVDVLAAPDLPDKASLRGNIMARHIAPVAGALGSMHRFAIELREQYMRDGVQHIFGSSLKQVRNPRVNLPLPQANRIVDGDEGIEASVHRGKSSAGAKFAKGLVKNFGELYRHVDGRVARPAVGWPGGDARRSIG